MAKDKDKKKKDREKEPAKPVTGEDFLRLHCEQARAELLKVTDAETLEAIGKVIKDHAFKGEDFDGRRYVVGYKRAVKAGILGEDPTAVSKTRG